MLTRHHIAYAAPGRQQGVVLFITLIVLVAMTLAAISMMRSVDTGNVIAGNLAFRQAATNSGDSGIEAAIAWLGANKTGTYLNSDHDTAADAMGYTSNKAATPAPGQTWDNYWMTVLVPNSQIAQVRFDATGVPNAAGARTTDNAGNQMSYNIARICNTAGDPTAPGVGCNITVTTVTTKGYDNQGAQTIQLQYASQVYYRITVRVEGPRNTVSYVQSIVAM